MELLALAVLCVGGWWASAFTIGKYRLGFAWYVGSHLLFTLGVWVWLFFDHLPPAHHSPEGFVTVFLLYFYTYWGILISGCYWCALGKAIWWKTH